MTINRMKRQLTRIAVLSILAILIPSTADAGRKFHVIVTADTLDSKIGDSCWADVRTVRRIFQSNVPASDLSVYTHTGSNGSARRTLERIQGLSVGRDDVIVFYFAGHGAFEANRKSHVLAMYGGRTHRRVIRDALLKKRARLAVLLTDTCSSLYEEPKLVSPASPHGTVLFRRLFHQTTGLVDVSSTKPGEEAIGDKSGGLFTKSLSLVLDQKSNSSLSWNELLNSVNWMTRRVQPASRQTAYAVAPIGKVTSVNHSASKSAIANSTKISGSVKSVSMSHNQYQNGEKGVWIYPKFSIKNARAKTGYVRIFFNCVGCGKRLAAVNNSRYSNNKSQVMVTLPFQPSYNSSSYNSAKVFLPYSALNRSTANHPVLSYDVHLHIMNGGKEQHVAGLNGTRFHFSR